MGLTIRKLIIRGIIIQINGHSNLLNTNRQNNNKRHTNHTHDNFAY